MSYNGLYIWTLFGREASSVITLYRTFHDFLMTKSGTRGLEFTKRKFETSRGRQDLLELSVNELRRRDVA
jgi:hypothetical protein